MAILIQPDGTKTNVRPADPARGFTLAEYYQYVCPGDPDPIVQAVPLPGGITAWCHEEGKLRGLPPNPAATLSYGAYLLPGDYFVGPVLLTAPAEEEGVL
jgi:hypothetical protein